jgi:hypothetical protein
MYARALPSSQGVLEPGAMAKHRLDRERRQGAVLEALVGLPGRLSLDVRAAPSPLTFDTASPAGWRFAKPPTGSRPMGWLNHSASCGK